MKNYTLDEVLRILKNVDIDVNCGACVEGALTGMTTSTHTCDYARLAVSVQQLDSLEEGKESRGSSCLSIPS
jgi:hypothetical protein